MAEHDQSPEDRLSQVQAMSLRERQTAIDAGVVEDLEAASAELQAFAHQATQRYLAALSHE